MEQFIAWLAATKASAEIQNIVWVIPAVQSIHILAVCVLMSSAVLLNLRLLGVIGGGEPMEVFTRRYLPWVGLALVVLLLSGSILITGGPNRDLNNWTFWTKMSLLAVAVTVTLGLELPVARNGQFWLGLPRRHVARVLAVLALACWIGIVLCGRWIAYTYVS